MSDEAQRIAIAEVCGWTHIGEYVGLRGIYGHKPGLPFGCLSKVPDYLADLNAMHEAEKVLTRDQLWTSQSMLSSVCRAGEPLSHANATKPKE